jgi:SAM-dependent methyltransferase
MNALLARHALEIERNRSAWRAKPLLQRIYAGFYARIIQWIDEAIPGPVVEIGSGIGNLKACLPHAICTDLFPNPWLDLVCDGYELPFGNQAMSHLVLFDVFHHLETPRAFLSEARRVLRPAARLILFEPFISWLSFPAYGLFHHEPVAWRQRVSEDEVSPRPRAYYAAQGNPTRLFFEGRQRLELSGWEMIHREAFSSLSYLLSGGYSKPAFYPNSFLPRLEAFDAKLSRWPKLFGARCLVVLRRQ